MTAHLSIKVEPQPSAWLVAHARFIAPAGNVLDVAAGVGRNSRWLAAHGYQVEAVDINAEALAAMHGIAGISTKQADLEGAPWPYAENQFDAIVVCRYLHRPLFPALLSSLKLGGALIYETFMRGHEQYGKPSSANFLLQPGELKSYFAPLSHIAAYEEGLLQASPPAMLQRICAIKG